MARLRILALTYKTFPMALSMVHEATVATLKRMGMRVLPHGVGDDGASVRILASGWRRELEVELDAQGVRCTRVRVLAKEGVFFEENAATDLIDHVTRLLERPPDAWASSQAARVAGPMATFSSRTRTAAPPH